MARIGEGVFDVLVVGGGINGAVSAACLAARGAQGRAHRPRRLRGVHQPSSRRTWPGAASSTWRAFEFGLVRKLCMSRNHLIRSYPSTVQEIRFYAVARAGLPPRPLEAGPRDVALLAHRQLLHPAPRRLLAADHRARRADHRPDAQRRRLRVLRRLPPRQRRALRLELHPRALSTTAASAANYVESLGATRGADGVWVTACATTSRTAPTSRSAPRVAGQRVRALSSTRINARAGQQTAHRHVFSKGIHLIVDRLTPNRRVLTFFADDGRLFFVIPMGPRTCIGTTDTRVESPIAHVTDEDRRFVLDNINKRLRLPAPAHARTTSSPSAAACVRWRWPPATAARTARTGLQLSRKHVVEVDAAARHVSIFGGKLTDCLNVGEEVCRARASARRRAALPRRALVRRAARRARARVLPPGAADGPRRDDLAALVREAHHAPLAPVRRQAFGLLERHPRRPAHGRGAHRGRRSTCAARSSSPRATRWS